MSLEIITVMHKYDIADFMTYSYWQMFFAESGTFIVNGSQISGAAGSTIEMQIYSTPIYVSGSTELYLLGSECACGPFYPAYTGSTDEVLPQPTPRYNGNIGMGTWNWIFPTIPTGRR